MAPPGTIGPDLAAGDLAGRARDLAARLAGLGVRRGRKVGVHLPPGEAALALCLALWSLGAVVVPLDPGLGAARLMLAVQGAAPHLLIHDQAPVLRLTGLRVVGLATLDSAPPAPPRNAPRPDDPALILFGDGEQDGARGVILSHRALLAAAQGLAARLALAPGDGVALPLTLNHAVRLTGTLACLLAGAGLSAPDAASHLVLADPGATRALIARPQGAPRVILAAGEGPAIRHLARLFPGARVFNAYARAELAGVALASDPRDPPHTAETTVGRPLPGVEVMIVDPKTGFDMLLYETGEIWIRAKSLMQRYYHAPEATRAALEGSGFFRTGDMGYLDSEGRVILSRAAHPQV